MGMHRPSPLSSSPMASSASTRSLLEVALGFAGALLIVPLLLKSVTGLVRTVFRFSTTRRLLGDIAIAGLSSLLLREGVLDSLFGRRGKRGDGLLKPRVEADRTR